MAELAAVREPDWLKERRSGAARRAAELDLPRFKGRAGWEFTDLAKLDLAAFTAAAPGEGDASAVDRVDTLLEAPEGAIHLGQVDGRVLDGGTEDGALVVPLTLAVESHAALVEQHLGQVVDPDQDVFTALNDAGWTGGAFVYVPRGVKVEAPIVLTAISDAAGVALHRRVLVVLDEGAEAEVWEQHLSGSPDGEALLNSVVELRVGQNARLRFVGAQDMNERSYVFGSQRAEVARDGSLDWVVVGFGSGSGKVRTETLLAGEGSHAKVTGAYAPHARQHIDYDTTQEHGAANTTSDLAFRGILADRSSAVWRGMIKVDPGAQQTDAFQECRNLLLSKRAHADAIPGLEILANDVRCTHAAAIAQIDPEQVFYLRSRGLGEDLAKRLVIEGFMAELVERFEPGAIRDAMAGALERRLQRVLG
ncbi:MAG TPA: Fe-S cluster assembly protein SufD [Solirubrobacteraceae bacterium]|nr:Fe-S cluster assembly protein SufD [Solirubrobacteraceae bacterium]